MPKRPLKRYYLEKSEDAGNTYSIARESSNLDELLNLGSELDSEGVRWVIKDRWLGEVVDCCQIFYDWINFMKESEGESPISRETSEPYRVPWYQIDTYESRRFLRKERAKRHMEELTKLAREYYRRS